MSKISELKPEYLALLEKSGIERSEALAEIELILRHVCNCSAKDILLNVDITKNNLKIANEIINERISTKRPIQQILGVADFFGEKFFVTSDTLIPRPETELLVDEALKYLKNIKNPKILDIGTGSGNITCSIAKNIRNPEVIGVDISTKALQIAIKNAEQLGVTKKALFRKSNIFSNVTEKFDMIISNPPYIPKIQKNELQAEVRDFEPELALFADDEQGIKFYENIITEAAQYLNLEGYLLFEIGINQSSKVQELLSENSFRVLDIIKDFNNIERVIVAQID